jgi:hypothetical protein
MFLLITALTTPALAYKPNSIEFHPLMLIVGLVEFRYERAVSEKFGAYGEFGYGFQPVFLIVTGDEKDDYDWQILEFAGGGRYYPGGNFRGVYIGADIEYMRASSTYKPDDSTAATNVFFPAGIIGYKWVLADTIPINLGIGGGYVNVTGEGSSGGSTETLFRTSGAWITGEVTRGFAF